MHKESGTAKGVRIDWHDPNPLVTPSRRTAVPRGVLILENSRCPRLPSLIRRETREGFDLPRIDYIVALRDRASITDLTRLREVQARRVASEIALPGNPTVTLEHVPLRINAVEPLLIEQQWVVGIRYRRRPIGALGETQRSAACSSYAAPVSLMRLRTCDAPGPDAGPRGRSRPPDASFGQARRCAGDAFV